MNKFFILYFRENNGEGEYIVLTDQNLVNDEIAEHELFGYTFHSKVEVTTNNPTFMLPFETNLVKSN